MFCSLGRKISVKSHSQVWVMLKLACLERGKQQVAFMLEIKAKQSDHLSTNSKGRPPGSLCATVHFPKHLCLMNWMINHLSFSSMTPPFIWRTFCLSQSVAEVSCNAQFAWWPFACSLFIQTFEFGPKQLDVWHFGFPRTVPPQCAPASPCISTQLKYLCINR